MLDVEEGKHAVIRKGVEVRSIALAKRAQRGRVRLFAADAASALRLRFTNACKSAQRILLGSDRSSRTNALRNRGSKGDRRVR